MVCNIDQQGWAELEDFTTIGVDKVKEFRTVCWDGNFEEKDNACPSPDVQVYPPLLHAKEHLVFGRRCFKMTKTEFKYYCGSAQYHADAAVCSAPVTPYTNPKFEATTTSVEA
jgi:hypothetical protein